MQFLALGGKREVLGARIKDARVRPDAVTAMVRGFAACDPKAALPEDVFAPLGVGFLDPKRATVVHSSLANPMKDRSVLRLVGNDPARTETTADGRFLVYGGRYRLRKSVGLDGANLRGVGEIVDAGTPRVRVGVTYTFDKLISEALAGIESGQGVTLKSRISGLPKSGGVWIELGADGRSATCWRFAD